MVKEGGSKSAEELVEQSAAADQEATKSTEEALGEAREVLASAKALAADKAKLGGGDTIDANLDATMPESRMITFKKEESSEEKKRNTQERILEAKKKKQDHYELLGVPKDASDDEIKKVYRDLSMHFHPDRNVGDDEAAAVMKIAADAYNTISNTEKREKYDQELFEKSIAPLKKELRKARRELEKVRVNIRDYTDVDKEAPEKLKKEESEFMARIKELEDQIKVAEPTAKAPEPAAKAPEQQPVDQQGAPEKPPAVGPVEAPKVDSTPKPADAPTSADAPKPAPEAAPVAQKPNLAKAVWEYANSSLRKAGLTEYWEELKTIQELYKKEKDEKVKKNLSEGFNEMYEKVKKEYKEKTGRELREDIKQMAMGVGGVEYMSEKKRRKGLEAKAGKELKAEEKTERKKIEKERQNSAIQFAWNRLTRPEQQEFRDENGELSIEKYAEYLEEERNEINEELKPSMLRGFLFRDVEDIFKPFFAIYPSLTSKELIEEQQESRIEIPKGVFLEMINRGYKPEEIKKRRFFMGIKLPRSAKNIGKEKIVREDTDEEELWKVRGAVTMSEKDFRNFVKRIGKQNERKVEAQLQPIMEGKKAAKMREIEEKIKKERERFKNIKGKLGDVLVGQVPETEAKKEEEKKERIKNAKSVNELYAALVGNGNRPDANYIVANREAIEDHIRKVFNAEDGYRKKISKKNLAELLKAAGIDLQFKDPELADKFMEVLFDDVEKHRQKRLKELVKVEHAKEKAMRAKKAAEAEKEAQEKKKRSQERATKLKRDKVTELVSPPKAPKKTFIPGEDEGVFESTDEEFKNVNWGPEVEMPGQKMESQEPPIIELKLSPEELRRIEEGSLPLEKATEVSEESIDLELDPDFKRSALESEGPLLDLELDDSDLTGEGSGMDLTLDDSDLKVEDTDAAPLKEEVDEEKEESFRRSKKKFESKLEKIGLKMNMSDKTFNLLDRDCDVDNAQVRGNWLTGKKISLPSLLGTETIFTKEEFMIFLGRLNAKG